MTPKRNVVVGREDQKKELRKAVLSGKAELIALYGRRRIGKTYLVREVLRKEIIFEFSGNFNDSFKQQLENFSHALADAAGSPVAFSIPKNWPAALRQLADFCKQFEGKKRIVLFFDELPWIDTHKSGFLSAFTYFWNSWASKHNNVMIVVSGSSASWMIRHLLYDKGGLHNRLTRPAIKLLPFTLLETEQFLQTKGISISRLQILTIYMALGGVPYYLNNIERGDTAATVIDRTCFTETGALIGEFETLFRSLFSDGKRHMAIIRALAVKGSGLTRNEIIQRLKVESGGTVTELLFELSESGFIKQWPPYDKTVKDGIYKLSDEFSLFHLKFMEHNRSFGKGTWAHLSEMPSWKSWGGFAFERICLKHVSAIKSAIPVHGLTEDTVWRYVPKKGTGAQIDLLIDRRDNAINICEMKFSRNKFTIDKKYAGELENKKNVFSAQSKTTKDIYLTFVTTQGITQNSYAGKLIDKSLSMDALFK